MLLLQGLEKGFNWTLLLLAAIMLVSLWAFTKVEKQPLTRLFLSAS